MQSRPLVRPRLAVLPAAALAACALALLSCRLDPVPQEIIDSLGPEDGPGPSELHRAGQPCVVCHGSYGGAQPQMVFGGTLYVRDGDTLIPAPNVKVTVYDSAGGFKDDICSNAAGNFYWEKKNWPEVAFPLTADAGSRRMRSLVGRDGSCATCHKPADPDSTFPAFDPVTGASQDSAGVILVQPSDVGADPKCQ